MKTNCPICKSKDLVFDVPIVKKERSTPLEINFSNQEYMFMLEVPKSEMTYIQYTATIKGNFCATCGFVMLNIDSDLAQDLKKAKQELDEQE